MVYEVLKDFTDLKDGGRVYRAGMDTYPRDGHTPAAERVAALCSENNVRKEQLIKPQEENTQDEKTEESAGQEKPEAAEEKPARKTSKK